MPNLAPSADRPDPRLSRAVAIAHDLRDRLSDTLERAREPIAIVGIGCRLPGGVRSTEDFWQLLATGVDGVVTAPTGRWGTPAEVEGATPQDPPLSAGFLDDVESFDPGFFGVAPREARRLDPQQRLFLEVGWSALEDAGCTRGMLAGSATGVFVGANATDHLQLSLADPNAVDMYTVVGNANCIIANRLSYALDLHGPSMVIDTACSSSLVALHLACQSLRLQECDRAVVGGVNLILSPVAARSHQVGLPVAVGGRCRTFDAAADGYARGEGVVAVVVRRLSDAVRDGDRVWAVVHGSAINQDGMTQGIAAPNGLSQRRVIERAVAAAGVRPDQVTLIEAHGTGTSLGDPIEVEALTAVYGQAADQAGRCGLGSVKTNLGHLEAAAGLTGVVKAALALAHRTVPPNLHFRTLNPNIELADSRFFIPTELTAWDEPAERRFAAVSAFGAGGTNAHAILGPAPERDAAPAQLRTRPCLLALSAPSEAGLKRMAESYRDFLLRPPAHEQLFADLCHTAAQRRTQHEFRLCVVADSAGQAGRELSGWLAGAPSVGVYTDRCSPPISGRTVFVFPGQGAQRAGMGRALFERSEAYRQVVSEADEHFRHWIGRSVLGELDRIGGPDSDVALVQPALFTVSVGLAAILGEFGITPDAVLGHSMGEVAAAQVAGALSMADATRVIGLRSRLLRRISGQGQMLVVGLDQAEAAQVVAEHAGQVSVAVVNSPRSTVLSGDPATLGRIANLLRERNVFTKLVQVDVASHSPQVDPLTEDLLDCLTGLEPRKASVPMMSAVTASFLDGSELDPGYWVANLRDPVLFWPATSELIGSGHDVFLELSPHPVLTGAVEQALEEAGRRGVAVTAMHRDADDATGGLAAVAAMHCAGLPVDLRTLWEQQPRVVSLPGYPYEKTVFPLPRPRAAGPEPAVAEPAGLVELPAPVTVLGRPELTACVLAAVAAELGADAAQVDLDAGFFQIGMDSRLATAARLRIEAALGRRLAATVMFEQPTVRQLTEYLLELLNIGSPAATAVVSGPAEPPIAPARPSEALYEMSAQDLQALLADEIRLAGTDTERSLPA
ncbi:type I polyketide synthase [Jatrophihabitans lederbergiae]|uniref:Beta-ketoacyl synthase N-terminal-like domain-containing protein n=1 Tax=Jatrophihabitans lederbergiae TaxID=3075547 RepID=A0ABU2JGK7_9ACTN|nr:beta-ketoacyl synthase N-terminal-like domain-containing protein [Jatrophihabitans sp. DSM 44399]MDT0263829.1 beta-ketoacyl synthase N-terminal-like domain-containing protein [Jatrophihabitans sp. DSM 44399]